MKAPHERRVGEFGANHTDFAGKGQPVPASSVFVFISMPRPLLSPSAPWPVWGRDRHAARCGKLLARGRISAFTRRWFEAGGFIEVEPATLQASPGNETHLHGFRTALVAPDGSAHEAWLHTSPEFAMKKLLAAGQTQIFALARVFRNRERTSLHAPEFTMLEWYRGSAPLERLIDDCAALTALAAHVAGISRFVFRGRETNPFEPAERLSVRDAFLRHADLDLFESLPVGGPPDAARFALKAKELGLRVAPDDGWSDIFSRLLSERVEPHLGIGRPTALHSYPAGEAALARLDPADPRVAERFEFYCCGVELANAFRELTDPVEQRRRFAADMAEQQRIYGTSAPIDEDFLTALAHMPDASGAALGFDRLLMLATGAESLESVQWTPVFDPGEARDGHNA
jgi:elongation factor P--(R)-beta-lysine ligase